MLLSVVCVMPTCLPSGEKVATNEPVAGSVELAIGAGGDVAQRQCGRAAKDARAVGLGIDARAGEAEERRGDFGKRRHRAPVRQQSTCDRVTPRPSAAVPRP